MPEDVSMTRVRLDADLCEGHALCIQLAPEVFDLSDDVSPALPRQTDSGIKVPGTTSNPP